MDKLATIQKELLDGLDDFVKELLDVIVNNK